MAKTSLKIIGWAIFGICCMIIAWGFISWIEVISNNSTPGYTYSSYNLINLITNWAKTLR